MENQILIITALVLIVVLAISIYFFVFKKKNNSIENNEHVALNEQETIITKEQPIENNLEIIIDKEIEKSKTKPKKDIIESNELIEKPIEKEEKPTKTVESLIKDSDTNHPKLNINISTKTEKVLLKKLEAFEKSKDFLKKDVNLNNLSKQFDTNTKYLSEIIKSYKNKNFNQYLNELRIDYLINQLNNNEKVLNTKVSYLASDFGFNSHSSFSTLFTQYVGQSPSEYIKALKDAKKEKITN